MAVNLTKGKISTTVITDSAIFAMMARVNKVFPGVVALLPDRRPAGGGTPDREERPDLDRLYMSYVQAVTGRAGWPLSVGLTPSLKPFFGVSIFAHADGCLLLSRFDSIPP